MPLGMGGGLLGLLTQGSNPGQSTGELLRRFPNMPGLLSQQKAGAFNDFQQEDYLQMLYGTMPGTDGANALRQVGLRLGAWRPKPHEPSYGQVGGGI